MKWGIQSGPAPTHHASIPSTQSAHLSALTTSHHPLPQTTSPRHPSSIYHTFNCSTESAHLQTSRCLKRSVTTRHQAQSKIGLVNVFTMSFTHLQSFFPLPFKAEVKQNAQGGGDVVYQNQVSPRAPSIEI